MSVLSDKVWVMDKLGEYSKEVEKQVEVLKDSPAHMYQWMADTREKQAEVPPPPPPVHPQASNHRKRVRIRESLHTCASPLRWRCTGSQHLVRRAPAQEYGDRK